MVVHHKRYLVYTLFVIAVILIPSLSYSQRYVDAYWLEIGLKCAQTIAVSLGIIISVLIILSKKYTHKE